MKRYIPYLLSFFIIPIFPCIYGILKLQNLLPEIFIRSQTLIISLFSLFVIVFMFLYFFTLSRIIQSERTALEVQILQRSRDLQLAQEKRLEEIQKHATINQQAIEKQLYNLQQLLKSHDTDKVKLELDNLTAFCQSKRLSKFCSDSLLNAILLCKKEEAEDAHISVDFQMFLPDTLQLPDPDLVTVFFNLLDNGIEACRASACDTPFLTLKVENRSNFLHIKMENSKNSMIHFDHTTTKQNTSEHGFGLTIIEHIIDKYDGTCNWLDHGNTFESRLMLRLPASSASNSIL